MKVVVSSPKVKKPIAVRYAWADAPNCTLRNQGANLPASPFRTGQFPGNTVGNKLDFSFLKDPRWHGLYPDLP